MNALGYCTAKLVVSKSELYECELPFGHNENHMATVFINGTWMRTEWLDADGGAKPPAVLIKNHYEAPDEFGDEEEIFERMVRIAREAGYTLLELEREPE